MAIEKVTVGEREYYFDTDKPLYNSCNGNVYRAIPTNPDEKNPTEIVLVSRGIKISNSDEDLSQKLKTFIESTKVIKR